MEKKLDKENLGQTSSRKLSHVDICLKKNIESRFGTKLEDFHFVHRAISSFDFEEIDTQIQIFGKTLAIPLISAAMTGGHPDVQKINETVAIASQKFQFGLGVGSQRAAIEKNVPYVTDSFKITRKLAPDSLIIGNLGAAQFSKRGKYGKEEMLKAVELIGADAVALHVNPGQELVQIEGDTFFRGFFENINTIAKEIDTPIILKEVGSGFSQEDALMVENSNISGIDVGGLGGTTWIGVEAVRARDNSRLQCELGELFWDWGIPTSLSTIESRSVTQKVIIATGGVRNGLEAAKLIALGADIVGMALPFLKAADKGMEEVEFFLKRFTKELKMAMFLTGCKTLSDLRKTPIVITGHSKQWLVQRGIDFKMPWRYNIK